MINSGYRMSESYSEELLNKVCKSLDDAKISYRIKGNKIKDIVVAKKDLEKASKIRDEIDPDYSIKVCCLA